MVDLHRTRLAILRLLALIALTAPGGLALDPGARPDEYIQTGFTVEGGLPSNVVNAILQTRNGFLWIGTDAGLARFDGRRFVPLYFRSPPPGSQGIVQALAEGPNGDLWIGTGAGLARIARAGLDFFDRSFSTLFHIGPGIRDEVKCLRFDHAGFLWVGTSAGLYRFANGTFVPILSGVITRIEGGRRDRLLIVVDGKFAEWDGRRIVNQTSTARQPGFQAGQITDVLQDHGGTTWFCALGGLAKRENGKIRRVYGTNDDLDVRARRAELAYEDRQGTVWVQFANALYRLSSDAPELLLQKSVRVIYSDRDGVLWAGTNGEGLFRFKDRLIRMLTQRDGLPNDTTMTVLKRKNGTLWVGNNCAGLSVWNGHRFRTFAERDGLSNSCVWALAEDQADNLWIGTWGGGMFRFANGHFTQFSEHQGLPGKVVRAIHAAPDGSLWIATDGGVSHMAHGKFRNYTRADGLSSDRILSVYEDRYGAVWAGTSGGVDRMSGNRFIPTSFSKGILDPRSLNFGEDASGTLYVLNAPRGLAAVEGGRPVNINQDLELFGMAAIAQDLWLSGGNGLFRFARNALERTNLNSGPPLNYTVFGVRDGMNTAQCSIGTPNIAVTPDGKLWVATVAGLAELDVRHMPSAETKPATFVTEVTVDRARQVAGRELILPPGPHHVEFHFNSISLTSPEKIRFQYRLDGIDPEWLDADGSLAAVYTSIPTGVRRFHVRACNVDGVWDPVGIAYEVTQRPYFYETAWFRWDVFLTAALLLAGLYRLRLRQIANEFTLRLEERVNERTRIARELHDTLLQSFHGLMLRFQAVQNLLPERPLEARRSLAIAIDRAAEAITEGRDAVQELRSNSLGGKNLVESLTVLGEDLAANHAISKNGGPEASFRVLVEGLPRQLHTPIQEDLYCISREAIANAFRHARAKQIELDLRYGRRMLRLRVRDDGIGIDRNLLARGAREEHWGLPGMRERATAIGANFEVWSDLDRGTEIELTVPASVAYASLRRGTTAALS